LFLTLMFLFVRVLPLISIFEMRTLLPSSAPGPLVSLERQSGAAGTSEGEAH
jgi:hypothetical protein